MLIGVSGKARSGKDLLLSFAAKEGWKKASFAYRLKEIVRDHFKLTEAHTDGWLKDTACSALNDHTPRELLIDLGNLYRKYHENYWVEAALKSFDIGDNFMFTDVRYPNEANEIRNHGGILIRLERHPSRSRLVSEETKQSVSETALDGYKKFDFVLDAKDNETPEQLAQFWNIVSGVIKARI